MKYIMPRTEIDDLLDEIIILIKDPTNYGKVAINYLRLHNIYGVLIGKTTDNKPSDDKYNTFLAQYYEKQYKKYRELYIEQKIKQTE
jgi:hypothetical protein